MHGSEPVPRKDNALQQELIAVLEKAEAFDTCYDADRMGGQDPSCAAYDMTSDPIKHHEDDLIRYADVQQHLLENAVMPGAPYTSYGEAAETVLNMGMNIGAKLCLWFGGTSNNYVHRKTDGDHASKVPR